MDWGGQVPRGAAFSAEAEVQLEAVEPGHLGIAVFLPESVREILVVRAPLGGVGSVVVCHDNGVLLNPHIALQSAKEVFRQMVSPEVLSNVVDESSGSVTL